MKDDRVSAESFHPSPFTLHPSTSTLPTSLVLLPNTRQIKAAIFRGADRSPFATIEFPLLEGAAKEIEDVIHGDLADRWVERELGIRPDVVGVRLAYGGRGFDRATLLSQDVLERLSGLDVVAPLHVPLSVRCLQACRDAFPRTPVVLAFDTAFFAKLPVQETMYAVAPEHTAPHRPSRCGYHGLYHSAACAYTVAQLRRGGLAGTPRLLSICLEPCPELTAVHGQSPWTITAGATPLEGLPGHTSCGEIDPSIVLLMAEQLKLGPEQINRILTQESGLLGLAGRPIALDSLWCDPTPDLQLVRELMEYRLLLACGAGIAALGGLDALVFSGRYARTGDALGKKLATRLQALPGLCERPLPYVIYGDPLETIVADVVRTVYVSLNRPHATTHSPSPA